MCEKMNVRVIDWGGFVLVVCEEECCLKLEGGQEWYERDEKKRQRGLNWI